MTLPKDMTDLRRRMSLLAKSSIAGIDKLLDEAAKYRQAAPGLLEARDALQFCLTMNALSDEHESDHSCYAEQSLLGGLILDGSKLPPIYEKVTEDDFALDCHRRIFRHILTLHAKGEVIDIVTIYMSAVDSNEVEQIYGIQYLGEIAANTPSASNIEAYAKIVRAKAEKRRKMEKRVASVVR